MMQERKKNYQDKRSVNISNEMSVNKIKKIRNLLKRMKY